MGGSRREHCAGTKLCRLLGAYIHYGSGRIGGHYFIAVIPRNNNKFNIESEA